MQAQLPESLEALESRMIAWHAEIYALLESRDKDAGKIDRQIDLYRRGVKHYDEMVRKHNDAKLKPLLPWRVRSTVVPCTPVDLGARVTDPTSKHSQGLYRGKTKFAKLVHNLLTREECEDLRSKAESVGHRTLVKNISASSKLPKRNNVRCVIHNRALADLLWPRIAPLVPATFLGGEGEYRVLGLNPCFRFCKYEVGQYFAAHTDDVHQKIGPGGLEHSFITVVFYLNEGFTNGQLRFLKRRGRDGQAEEGDVRLSLDPRMGTVALFEHSLLHEGTAPGNQPKYLVRTDVVYVRKI
mmetsp:Transcript_5166/g.11364  ORF Transcript_5166/g.11364 Transcript_5166/m.11364 type:complete len:298 (+) Transcript_5166:78-971(+)